MKGVMVDSCVLLDLFTGDGNWADWSENTLDKFSQTNTLYINSVIYTEISIGFNKVEAVEAAIDALNVKVLEMPREALYLAGKVFTKHRKNKGAKNAPLPDFFIGAHASVSQFGLVTRDIEKFKTYYPKVNLIHPHDN
jgi:predicted nucleic acid-binding protein